MDVLSCYADCLGIKFQPFDYFIRKLRCFLHISVNIHHLSRDHFSSV
jgi:hypothetical protein